MPLDLTNANVIVIVFVMDGCPACENYLPRFKRIAKPYSKAGIQIAVFDANSKDDRVQDFADRINVRATPTTAVLPRGQGLVKVEGAVDDATIKQLLDLAYARQQTAR